MPDSLPKGALRVQRFLASKNSKAQVQMLPDTTATAKDAASQLGVKLHQIGKSIVFGSGSEVIIAVVCGDKRINTDIISKALKINEIGLLKASEVQQSTGFVIGGVSPFDLPSEFTIIIDSGLHNQSDCFVAVGHPKAVVKTSGREIVAITNATIIPITGPA